jgi:hypothetical protein
VRLFLNNTKACFLAGLFNLTFMQTPLEQILYWAETKKDQYSALSEVSNDPSFHLGRIDVMLELVALIYKKLPEEKEMIENAYEDGKTGNGRGSHYYESLFNQDS